MHRDRDARQFCILLDIEHESINLSESDAKENCVSDKKGKVTE